MNEYFQGTDSRLIELDDSMKLLYKDLLQCYMTRDYVNQTEISSINPENKQFFLPQMYLGVKIMQEVQKTNIVQQKLFLAEFYTRCCDFLVTGCKEIRKRHDFSNEIRLKYLSPKEAVRHSNRQNFPSMLPLTQKLPRIVNNEVDLQKIDDEWRLLPDINKFSTLDIGTWKAHEFWEKILTTTDCKILAKFALDVLCIPHSNADCERIFSQVNNMKTKARNKLITSTVNKTLLARQLIKNQGNCTKFKVSRDMCDKMRSKEKYTLDKHESEIIETVRNLYGEETNEE